MRLRVAARNLPLTELLSDYLEKRLSRLDRFSTRIIDGEVVLSQERGQIKGELVLRVKRGVLVVRANAPDAFQVVDLLRDRMKARLKRYEARWHPRRAVRRR